MATEVMIKEGHAVPYTGGSKAEIQEMHLKNRERLIAEGVVTI
jgi:endonuclease YncB( thermonuclease family)